MRLLETFEDVLKKKIAPKQQQINKGKVIGYGLSSNSVTVQDFSGNIRTVVGGRNIYVGNFITFANIGGESVAIGESKSAIGTIKIVDV